MVVKAQSGFATIRPARVKKGSRRPPKSNKKSPWIVIAMKHVNFEGALRLVRAPAFGILAFTFVVASPIHAQSTAAPAAVTSGAAPAATSEQSAPAKPKKKSAKKKEEPEEEWVLLPEPVKPAGSAAANPESTATAAVPA